MASDVMARSRAADDGSMFNRPWLAFYDRRARPPPCAADVPAILRALDENSLCEIASRLGPRAFARLATTCAAFRDFVYAHDIDVWRGFCVDAFAHRESAAETAARKSRHGSYRAMFQQRLRLRTDGLYVSRNTYIKPGAKTMENAKCCHLVAYYRYFRFYRTGEFVCKTSPRRLRDEAKLLKDRAACARSNEVCHGGYTIDGEDRVRCEAIRPKSNGEWSATYFWVRLRQNKPGASNRLDVVKIAMVDGDNDPPTPTDEEWRAVDDEEALYRRGLGICAQKFDGTAEVRVANRGLSTLVFVPWDEVNVHELNKTTEEMDFYFTG
jgi:F-box protein 9|tara:strand:- start:4445 stop:5419 length:975 start_codon:yes stop_codon:yes gene_type:complete